MKKLDEPFKTFKSVCRALILRASDGPFYCGFCRKDTDNPYLLPNGKEDEVKHTDGTSICWTPEVGEISTILITRREEE